MKDFFFEYIYYRMTKFYFRWDGRMGITAILGISMIQFIVASDILAIIMRVFVKRSGKFNFPDFVPYLAVILFLLLTALNYYRYQKKYSSLKFKYKDEPKSIERKKTIVIILLLLIPWVVFFSLAAM
jgi:hypothetical protein